VVEADGTVVPVSYGFSKQYTLRNITNQRVREAKSEYLMKGRYSGFRNLCRGVFQNIINSDSLFLNWYELIVNQSHKNDGRVWLSSH
jgi:Fe-coproporphyrin III synthase